jgi:hypothetical protein
MSTTELRYAPIARDNGKPIRHKAQQTRSRFLDVLDRHIETTPFYKLSIHALARDTDVHATCFYRYFADLNEAITELASRYHAAGKPLPRHLKILSRLIDAEDELAAHTEAES